MSVTIPISIVLDFTTPASIQQVYDVLQDIPNSVSHFPKVDKLVDLGDGKFRWEMEKMGAQKYYFQVMFAAQYTDSGATTQAEDSKWVRWTPINDGNAAFSGCWNLSRHGDGTQVHFENAGHIELPFPSLTKRIVSPFVLTQFQELFDKYLSNLKQTFLKSHLECGGS